MSMPDNRRTRVAVVYHSVAVYRRAIFNRIFGKVSNPEYMLFAGTSSNQTTLKLVDPAISERSVEEGGWRWRVIRNYWIGQILIQPRVLGIPFERKWDCVIFLGNPYYLTTWIAAILCRLSGKRVLMWTHGYRSERLGRRAFFKNCFFRLAHGLILYGNRAKDVLVGLGFDADRLYVGYNSLDHDAHLALRHQFADLPSVSNQLFGNSLPVMVWVGRFMKEKEVDVLLRAIAVMQAANRNVNLLLVGEGPEKEALVKLSRELKVTKSVYFAGPVYDEAALAKLLMTCDIAVSPGPVGVFAILAQTFGLPVITSDEFDRQGPEVESIEDGITGGFFKAHDPSSLAEVLIRWLSDPRSGSVIREACYQAVDQTYTPAHQEQILSLAVE